MLVLSREKNEEVYITVEGRLIKVVLINIKGQKARLGFEADSDVSIYRKELFETMQQNKVT